MKSLLLSAFTILCFTANATNYYFSTSGNDANNGTSTSTPWKTLSKFNSVFASKSPGDNFLFNRGEVFYGKIIISRSGSSGLPMTIGAYGTGAAPVISGFTTVSGWTSLGGNIWESTGTVSSLPYTNMVVVNGVNTAMGRYPNSGFLTYQSHVGNSSITSSGLSGTPNWTGAELAFFLTTYIIARDPITSQSGGTLNYTRAATDGALQADGKGFLIQNDARTLDVQNEWYYNPSTKKLRIYSTSSPTNVQLTTIDTLAYLNTRNYITFDNVSFQGPNKVAILLARSTNITIQNCDFNFSGRDAIFGPYAGNSTALKVENCTFNHINNNAIFVTPDFDHPIIRLNTIKNVGVLPGMGSNGSVTNGAGDYTGISAKGANALIELNTLDGIGYKGIQFYGSNSLIQKNYVNNFCLTLHDGGGIYTWNAGPTVSLTGIRVLNNIVLNSPLECGIYMDDNVNGVEVSGNTIAGCSSGLYCHNNWNMTFSNNTMYDNLYAQYNMRHSSTAVTMRNNIFKNNILVSRTSSQRAAMLYPLQDVAPAFITDSNYYARPMDDNLTVDTYYNGVYGLKTFANLQTITGQEAHSKKSPKAITNVSDLRLEYNATTASKTVTLDGNYIDVKNVSYNGSITLAPYTSAVLIRNGAATINQPPTANAGADQSITLPTSTVSLSGSGSDADGTISSYNWTKIAGPASGTITNANSASTTVTGLIQGVYQFQIKVTDNGSATGLDTVQITVNVAGNIAPSADAGTDQVITLPTSDAGLSGSASDVDGTISSYSWTKVSGPSAGTITNTSSAATTVTGLAQGVYKFQCKATDNNAATDMDTVQITVNAAGNLLPAVNPANAVNGLDYKYYEGSSYSVVPSFTTLTPVKTGTSTNFDISLANRATVMAFNFTGYINVPADGTYTFYTNSDDGSTLYIDNVLVVNNDGLHGAAERSGAIGLMAGKHAISVGYFNQTGAGVLTVSYAGPGISKQVVPASSLYRVSAGTLLAAVNPANTVNGLDYSYYEGSGYSVVPTFSTLTPVKTGTTTNFNTSLSNRSTIFAFNFTGFIDVPVDGQYTFYANSDDGSMLYIDNVPVVNNDGLHWPVEKSGTIGLMAGKHAISVGYFNQTGSGVLTVSYAGPGVSRQAVPASALYRVSGAVALNNNGNQIITSSAQVGVKAYPNPFVSYVEVNVTGGVAGEYKLMLVDAAGRIVWTKSGTKNAGAFQQTINTSALQRGIYLLKVIQNNTSSVIKLVN